MKISVVAVTGMLLLPAAVLAASPFDGNWKASLQQSELSKKPHVVSLSDGTYTCTSCVPVITVKADGTDQMVTGHDYDSIAVTVVASDTVSIVRKVQGKAWDTVRSVVSSDGNTLTEEETFSGGAQPAVTRSQFKRASAGPTGAHELSGSWIATRVSSASDSAMTETLAMTADSFIWNSNGQSYEAKFNGRKYPVSGDPTHTMVTVKKISPTEVEESDYVHDQLDETVRMIVAADGKSLDVMQTSARDNSTDHFHMVKLP